MNISQQSTPGMKKIAEMIDKVGAGMLTTIGAEGKMSSRPMLPVCIDENGYIWFFTRKSSRKLRQLGYVNVAFSQPDEAIYVSMSGRAALVEDPGSVERLWSPLVKPWLPEGRADAELALLRVDADCAEYWDGTENRMVRFVAGPRQGGRRVEWLPHVGGG
jgi:general stress protein 26